MTNILTIFSGRRQNLEILIKYLQIALNKNIIQEVHFWNNTRKLEDEQYIQSISSIKRTSSLGKYVQLKTHILKNSFTFNTDTTDNLYLFLYDIDHINNYEITFGISKNVLIKYNNITIGLFTWDYILVERRNEIIIDVQILDTTLFIYYNNTLIIKCPLHDTFDIHDVFCKTVNSVGFLTYEQSTHPGFYFMDTCEKSWKNYYQHYAHYRYKNDIIIKCDDDIVFIDITKLPGFINFIKNNEYDLVFANTINNGVAAYYQQNYFNLIPYEEMTLEYPHQGFEGTLWESGKKAEKIHNYFIKNYKKFINCENLQITPHIKIKTRFSINFFGYKGKDWHKIMDCYMDDERNLTTEYIKHPKSFNNTLYTPLFVSHLSFNKQVETGINTDELINKYHELYETYTKQIL